MDDIIKPKESTQKLIDDYKNRSSRYYSTVVFGKGDNCNGSACFYSMEDRILGSQRTFHYILQDKDENKVDYEKFFEDLQKIFSTFFDIHYFSANKIYAVIEISNNIQYSFYLQMISYWLISSIIRSVDHEFINRLSTPEGKITDVVSAIYAWNLSGFNTNHNINESLESIGKHMRSFLKTACKIYVNKLTYLFGGDITIGQVEALLTKEYVTKCLNSKSSMRISQTPAFTIVENLCIDIRKENEE